MAERSFMTVEEVAEEYYWDFDGDSLRFAAGIVPENTDYEFLGIKASPRQQEYRNKMEFSFGDAYKDGPLALGMHKRGSFYDIVDVPE